MSHLPAFAWPQFFIEVKSRAWYGEGRVEVRHKYADGTFDILLPRR